MNYKFLFIKPINVLLIVLSFALISLTGCQSATGSSYDVGNPAADSLCFSSEDNTIIVEQNSCLIDVLDIGEDICVIYNTETSDNGEQARTGYKALILDGMSCSEKEHVDLEIEGHDILSFCYAGDNKIAAAETNGGYIVIDLDNGSICLDGSDKDRSHLIPTVSNAKDGFVYISDNRIMKIDVSGRVIGDIAYDEDIMEIPRCNAYFSKGDNEFVSFNNDMQMVYYLVDFDKGVINEAACETDFQLDWITLFDYGGFAYDRFSGVIYEIDPMTSSKGVCAYSRLMLAKPLLGAEDEQLYVLDKNRFIKASIFGGEMLEIELIKPDPELQLNEREQIIVRGDNALLDQSLAIAAYLYNTSQNDYLVSIDNYGDEYGYETTEDANRRSLKLIQDFQEGNAPDIFYGNTFDYNYMGRNSLVMDMKPYIDSSEVIDTGSLSDNIYRLFLDDDHCYQVFCGYQLFGLFGDKSIIGGRKDDISLYENKDFANTIRNRYSYSDVMSMLMGYPIYELQSSPDILNEEEIKRMLRIAVDIGISPEEQINGNMIINDNENTFLSYFGSFKQFQMMSIARGDTFTFIGYPTVGTCAHMASPCGLVAISAGTEHPDECFKFIECLYSSQVQERCLLNNFIPVNEALLNDYYRYINYPDEVPENDIIMQYAVSGMENDKSIDKADILRSYRSAIDSVDGLLTFDWGLHLIISDETNTYFYSNKDIDSIASSLRQRVILYLQENSMYGY